MLYAYVIAAAALFGGGFFTARQFDAAEIMTLQTAIERGNRKAEAELKIAQVEAANNAEKAAQLTHEIEVSHAQAVQTANALADRVAAAARLYASRSNCQNAVSGGNSSGSPETETEPADFSAGLAEIVRRADETAVYAQSCWQFVSANCGIAHDGPLLPD